MYWLIISTALVWAQLDPAYEDLTPPVVDERPLVAQVSPVEQVIHFQTSVKNQKKRGTCTIFATLGLLESEFYRNRWSKRSLDLSEEWLEYLVMRTRNSEGSNTQLNLQNLYNSGFLLESDWPYLGQTWEDLSEPLARERCGFTQGVLRKSCLLGHRDPRLLTASKRQLLSRGHQLYDPPFYQMRQKAWKNKKNVLKRFIKEPKPRRVRFSKVSSIRMLLMSKRAAILRLNFYYGAFNHQSSPKKGIPINQGHWYRGIVGPVIEGSIDYNISRQHKAGHALILVGFDDNYVIKRNIAMSDGSYQTITTRGAYIFKNSWGQEGFGKDFEYRGNRYPGYGVIPYQYAHQYGDFARIPLLR